VIVDPVEIERKSFEIIEKELGGIRIPDELKPVVFRVIHTTADFEYADILEFHPGALNAWISEIKTGAKIYTDTKMIIAGINKGNLKRNKLKVYTLVDDRIVRRIAEKNGSTRAIAGIEKACRDKRTKIFVLGNSPTALFRLKKLIEEKKAKPSLIIGVPVGFVGAAESKEEIKKTGIPYIITNGR
jgi:precorrin-8X/cobalt-precorrin-8 methylmutase